MSKMTDGVIQGSFGTTPNSWVANIADGGQNGFGPILQNLDGNTPPAFLPLTMVVTHVPTIFQYIPNGPRIFKALFEQCAISWDGLDFNRTMDTDGTPVGKDGQLQHIPTRQTRSQITPSVTWAEKLGNLIYNIGRFWMDAMHDPDTQASSMADIISSGTALPPQVASMWAADILAIQYSQDMRPENIVGAFAMTNFFPTDIGSHGFSMNVNEVHRIDRQFSFTCVVQDNPNVVAKAKQVAQLLKLHEVDYKKALPVVNDISQAVNGEGLSRTVANVFSQFQNLNGVVA